MGQPATILYLITSTNAGGTEKALWELVRRLDRNRFAAHVCSMKTPGRFAPRLAAAAAGFSSLELPEAGGLRAALGFVPACLRLRRLVRSLQPRIIHSFLFRANICGRLVARSCGVPAVISSLRVTEAKSLPHFIDGLTKSMVDSYTAVSEAVRQEAVRRAGIAPGKIITIANGIDCSEVKAAPVPAETSNVFTVALPGRLHRQKGQAVLLKALALTAGQEPAIQALLYGEGPDEECLRHMASELGITSRVRFMGVVENGAEALQQVDAVVMPSLWEGMPNAVLEAMALGKPVIASRIPGMDELVADGRTGLLCRPGSAEELGRALLSLARDRKRGQAMGAAARALVKQRFSLRTTVAATVALYDRLIAESTANQES